jgi:tetratricopeptide (TPR) repeat protein
MEQLSPPAGTPHLPASDQAPPADSVWTKGNQSPAVNSGGNVGTQYGTSSAAGERPLEMSSLGATARRFMSVFIMLTCAGPLAAQQATATGNQSPAVNAGGNVTINYAGMTPDEKAVFTRQIADTILVATKGKGASAVEPGTEQRVDQTIAAIAKGASEGDERLQQVLSLLAARKVAQAVPLLEAVAEDKTARIRQDSQVAAAAYRNLGAIAGLADPKKAREAYAEAARLDPNNIEGAYWHGYFEAEAGNLTQGEAAYRRAISLGAPGRDDWALYWAHVGLGDVWLARGSLMAATGEYEQGRSIAGRLAKADPGNAEWQRNLSVSLIKIGDVLVAQGNLPVRRTCRLRKPKSGRQRWRQCHDQQAAPPMPDDMKAVFAGPAQVPPPVPATAALAAQLQASARRQPAPTSSPASGTVVMRQPGNIRIAPQGAILRVEPRGKELRVFGEAPGGWLQIGDTEANGWVHSSMVQRR